MGCHNNESEPQDGLGVPSVVLISSPIRDVVSQDSTSPPSEQATIVAPQESTLPAPKPDEPTKGESALTVSVGASRGGSPTSSTMSQSKIIEETDVSVEIDNPSFDTDGGVLSADTTSTKQVSPGQSKFSKAMLQKEKAKKRVIKEQQVSYVQSKSPPLKKDEIIAVGATCESFAKRQAESRGATPNQASKCTFKRFGKSKKSGCKSAGYDFQPHINGGAQSKRGSALTMKKTSPSNAKNTRSCQSQGERPIPSAHVYPDKVSTKIATSTSDTDVKQRNQTLASTKLEPVVAKAFPLNRSQQKKKNQRIGLPVWANDLEGKKNATDAPAWPFSSPAKEAQTKSQSPIASKDKAKPKITKPVPLDLKAAAKGDVGDQSSAGETPAKGTN